MSRRTQGLVVALLAAVLIRLAWSGEYLRFVLPWMRWPLLATGVVLAAMALGPALSRRASAERVPWSTWLLVLPTLVVFAVSPPPLGAYLAEHRPAQRVAAQPGRLPPPLVVRADRGPGPLQTTVDEFAWGTTQDDDPMGLAGTEVQMDGFVSAGEDGAWYVTRLVIFCCAADAIVERVRVEGQPSPRRDQWVRVIGVWDQGAAAAGEDPVLGVSSVTPIPTPKDPYG